MRTLTFVALAASAAGFAPAMAQTVPDPDPYYGMAPGPGAPPAMRVRAAPPGTSWHAPAPQMQMQMRGPMGATPPQGMMQQQQQRYVVQRMGPGPAMGPGMGGQRHHVDYRRIDRGGVVPRYWWGPQVQVRNWQSYGFPQPFAGGRWIRYYDDALLIDGDGRVHDSRPGWDWDRTGDRWDYDDDGVPVYAGDGDYQPQRRDYEYAERYEHREMAAGPNMRQRVYVAQPPMPSPCGGGCGGGYGYGAGYGYGPVLVTETTITEPAVVEARTYVSYETVRVRVHHRRAVRRCGCRVSAPPRELGERG
jgi:Ni/Co efflux regulator RcnB